MKNIGKKTETEILRQSAERLGRKNQYKKETHLSEDEANKLLHKLQVQQLELEQRNKELQASERNLLEAEHLAQIGSWQWTLATDTVKWSEGLYRINKLDPNLPAPAYAKMSSYYTAESWKRLNEAVAKTLETGEPYEMELEIIMPDKTIKLTLARGETDYDSTGKIVGLHGTVSDLTERMQRESILKARDSILEFSFDSTLDQLLQKTLDEVEILTRSKISFFHFVEDDQVTVSIQAWSTNTLQKMCTAEGKRRHYPVDQAGVWVDCVKARKAVFHNDYASLPNRKGLPVGHAMIIRELVVPIMRGDKIVAILGVGNKDSDYDENDVATITQIADLAWDITGRKQTEEALQKSEQKYRQLYESIMDAVTVINMDGMIIDSNPSFQNLLGYSGEELAKLNLSDLTPEKWQKIDADLISTQVLARGYSDLYEKEIQRKDGTLFPVEIRRFLLKGDDGQPTGIYSIFRDITRRKQGQKELNETKELLSLFLKHSPVYAFIKEVTSTQSRVIVASENYRDMIGIPGSQMTGKTMEELFPAESAAKFTADDWLVVSSGQVLQLDEDLNGRHYNTIKFPITVAGKNLLAGYTIDITARKQAEAEVQVKNEELQKINAEKDKFFSIIAHDLKNPFNAIIGFSDLMLKNFYELDDETMLKGLRTMESASNHAYKLLENLLIWSQNQTGLKKFNPEKLDLTAQITESLRLIESIAINKGIRIIVNLKKACHVFADKNMLDLILRNLISNALKFSYKGGKVSISANKVDHSVQISVKDYGVGISADRLSSIFNIDKRTNTAGTENEQGTGLGLILCRDFVVKHGGAIWVESSPEKGSVFTFSLPLN